MEPDGAFRASAMAASTEHCNKLSHSHLTDAPAALMEPVAKRLHRRELLVDCYRAIGVALGGFPTIVDVHVAVAVISQAFVDESLSR